MTDDVHHRAWADAYRTTPVHAGHCGEKVRVGPYIIGAGGTRSLKPEHLDDADLLIPLAGGEALPLRFGRRYAILAAPLPDYGGVPVGWSEFVTQVVKELSAGLRIIAFCHGSHGRTGCLLASLIAVLETVEETPDPIAAVRERHCPLAVETLAQAAAAFALRGQPVPERYINEFGARKTFV